MIPITTIGGYLGAGKTTLINNLLRHANGRRLAVLVNEFGDLAIDEDLIEAETDTLISIAGGCICCSFGDDLVGAIMDLSSMEPVPDHIVIEASGVAIPSSIAASISLLQGVRSIGTVVLADAVNIRVLANDKYLADTITRQLTDADLVLVSKADLASSDTIPSLLGWLKTQSVNAEVVLGAQDFSDLDIVLGPRESHTPTAGSRHSDAQFESAVFELDQPVDAKRLADNLASAEIGLLRAKGFVKDLNGGTSLIQTVGRRAEVSDVDGSQKHAIVCISLAGKLARDEIMDRIANACRRWG